MTIETPISTGLANPFANNAASVGQSVLSGETIIDQPSDAKSAFDGTIGASTSTVVPGSVIIADISSAQFATAGTSSDAGEASAVTIAEGGSAEIDGPGTQSVTFTGTTGTLTIDHSLAFTGQISGLAGADALDLADLSYGANTTATFLGNTTGGTLTVTDGSPHGEHFAERQLSVVKLDAIERWQWRHCRRRSGADQCLANPQDWRRRLFLAALMLRPTAPWLSVPTPMVPISGMGRSGSSSLLQQVCPLHL